jgi:hypothetical protein
MPIAEIVFVVAMQSAAAPPPIASIDIYGLRRVTAEQVQQALQLKVGDRPPEFVEAIEKRLEAIPGVAAARVSCITMTGKTALFAGVREKGSPALQFRPAPKGTAALPDEILRDGRAFYGALVEAIEKGDAGDDESQGHSLMHFPAARAIQERFVRYAARDAAALRDVLHNSALPEHRALAAQVLAYAPDKRAVTPDLESAMLDSDPVVRNNAMRALAIIAQYAGNHPELRIEVHAHAFVELLRSLDWTDRNKASFALMALTESRAPALLEDLREHAMPELIEMARWNSAGHAYIAHRILGRIAGMTEEAINEAWARGDREAVIR